MGPRRLSSLGALLLLVVAGGCATVPAPQAVAPEARRALALLEQRWQEFSDLRTLAEIVLERGGERQQLIGVLLVRHPGSIRFEALSPFGQPYRIVTVHDGQLAAYDAARHEALVGPANAATIEQVLGLPLEAADLVAVLAARVAPPEDLRVAELLPADAAGPSLRLITPTHRQRVWLDLTTGVVHRVELEGGRLPVRISYVFEHGMPAGFDLDVGASYLTGSVRYRDPTSGVGLDPARFLLPLPKGAKIQSIR